MRLDVNGPGWRLLYALHELRLPLSFFGGTHNSKNSWVFAMRTHSGSLSSLSLFHVTQKPAKIKEKPSNGDGLRATPIIFGVIFEVFVEVEERNFRVLT